MAAAALADARAALAASTLAMPDGGATAHWRGFRLFVDRRLTPLTPIRVARYRSPSESPFRSLGAEVLLRDGFVREERGELVFSAPDAQVLLSEVFIGTHCFWAVPGVREHAEWIGVGFEPAGSRPVRGTAALEGTIWLDRRTSELRRVEFAFAGADALIGNAPAGGSLDFRRLDAGLWVVDRWELRMPRPSRVPLPGTRGTAPPATRLLVNVIEISGAVVDSVTRDGTVVHARADTARSLVPEAAARFGEAPTCDPSEAETVGRRGVIFGQVTDPEGIPRNGGVVRATWMAAGGSRFARADLRESRDFDARDGFFFVCELPVGVPIRLTVLGRPETSRTVRLPSERPFLAIDLVLRGR